MKSIIGKFINYNSILCAKWYLKYIGNADEHQ
jgi:hypothetical protein